MWGGITKMFPVLENATPNANLFYFSVNLPYEATKPHLTHALNTQERKKTPEQEDKKKQRGTQ